MARKLPRFLSLIEMDAVFNTSKAKVRDHVLLRSLFYLGLRNSELVNLKIDDIDLLNRTVKVVQGKGKKDRYVPIPKDFAEELTEYIKDRSGRLFGISDRQIRRIVKAYAVKAGVRKAEEIHPHTLRHSYATHLQNSGVPLNIIQEILGHENIETTTIYMHLGIARKREEVDKAFRTKYTIDKYI